MKFYSEAVRKIDGFVDSKTLGDWMEKRFELSESDKRLMDEIMEKHGFSYDEEDDKPKRSKEYHKLLKIGLEQDGGKCVLCGSNENMSLTIWFLFKGGANTIEIFKYFVNPVTEENLIISDSTRIILILTMI